MDLLDRILEGECRKLHGKSLFVVIPHLLTFPFAGTAWPLYELVCI
jgi:hypothetical protein